MMNKIKAGVWLHCGCCGSDFQTWTGYVDQDQDLGYGICRSCQADIDADNEAQFDHIFSLIRDGMSAENQARFDALSRDEKKAFAMQLIDDGHITFSVRSVHYG
ncbi:hypothetical protein [Ferrimonas balearica]|uniref:hypothetical protein n=1 Tax=Ferrimonas balearica TaxID=44012 RepID=UPI001F4119D8|nr:hypothetical protein [Ferrimonas balearica]MBY6093815.1 hypothetical protein [Ferrimonas balearica]